jgi:hypothetical protein
MLCATMPKAPVNENREFTFCKNEIRIPENTCAPAPARNSVMAKK